MILPMYKMKSAEAGTANEAAIRGANLKSMMNMFGREWYKGSRDDRRKLCYVED